MCPREKGFVLWGHCQNLLDDPRINYNIITRLYTLLVHYIENVQSLQFSMILFHVNESYA